MKPDGRSLDLAVVGLGQAGGNLAAEFFRRGYRALALNTAQTDLSALDPEGVYPTLPAERRHYIGLDGYDGAGMDPKYAAECIENNRDQLMEVIRAEAEDADAVLLCAGLGGGTGSALASLARVLAEEELPVLGLMTLPTGSESGIVKVNAVKAINELMDAPLNGWIFVDNSRIAELNQDVSIIDYYAHINGRIASPLDNLNRLNSHPDLRAIRSFDGEDFRKLLLAGGVLAYGATEIPNITVDEVVGAFKDCLEAGDLMPQGFDLNSISYVGLVIEAPEQIHAETSIGTFEEADRKIKEITGGAAIYRGIYRNNKPESAPVLRVIASSLGLPSRVRELLSDAQREGEIIRNKLREELPTLDLGEIEGFELFKPGTRHRTSDRPRRRLEKVAPNPMQQLQEEIVQPRRPAASQLGPRRPKQEKAGDRAKALRRPEPRPSPSGTPPTSVPHRLVPPPSIPPPRQVNAAGSSAVTKRPIPPRPEPRRPPQSPLGRAPIPVPSSSLMDEKGEEAETREIDLSGQQPTSDESRMPIVAPAPPPNVNPSDLPTPDSYDQMVSDFLHSESDDDREVIAQRLEEDSISEHSVVRYYAVEAMAKLGTSDFSEALRIAAQDANDAVRALAKEALRRGEA